MQVRELNSTDVFVAARLINKVGIKRIKEKIPEDKINELFNHAGTNEKDSGRLGMELILGVVPELLDIFLEAEEDIYEFLARLAETTPEVISMLPFDETMGMIEEIVNSRGFKSFFTVARRLAKRT